MGRWGFSIITLVKFCVPVSLDNILIENVFIISLSNRVNAFVAKKLLEVGLSYLDFKKKNFTSIYYYVILQIFKKLGIYNLEI